MKNPFATVEATRRLRRERSIEKIHVMKTSVGRGFDRWDDVVFSLLFQLGEALTLQSSPMLQSHMVQNFLGSKLAWHLLGSRAMYRVCRSRQNGSWALELFGDVRRSYYEKYFLKIQFGHDQQGRLGNFRVVRGADNRVFFTESLDRSQLAAVLISHFSWKEGGECIDTDLEYLHKLRNDGMLLEEEYRRERAQLLSNRHPEDPYFTPLLPRASREVRRVLLWERVFVTLCLLILAVIVLYTLKQGGSVSLKPVASPLLR